MYRTFFRLSVALVIALFAGISFSLADDDKTDKERQEWPTEPVEGLEWPREFEGEKGARLILYQPQVEAWEEYSRVEARVAVAFASPGQETPSLGSISVQSSTETDLETRQVRLSNFKIVDGSFPSLDDKKSKSLIEALDKTLPPEDLIISLDRVLASIERGKSQAKAVEVKTDPPKIIISKKPAILVLIDGKPILSPIKENDLKFVVNTNWDLFHLEGKKTYYLRHEDIWLKASALKGPWAPAGKLPKNFKKLSKDDPNWKEVHENLPGRKIKLEDVPDVHMSEVPAELIVIYGEPSLSLIPDTGLMWVKNTESDLFFVREKNEFYYLVSGRWFRAKSLDGEWIFASTDLPEGFANIPEDHDRGDVLASVPGTPQAEEAAILAQIPQKAEVERDKVEATVEYQGEPEFKPIEGTSMYYAANTSSDVIRVGDMYYLCFQAVWFVSASPNGPWVVADEVPGKIYEIPESSPVYNVTYVRVYSHTPTHVVFGFTSGYYGVYYSHGCMVYGTGWYYPPYVYWGPHYPYYYHYPVSYGMAAFYNPYTGTYGRGARYYGPYGGAGYGARYNPRTGAYARGAAAYGPYNARGWAEAYNPRTGAYARTRQGANPYSHWGTTAVSRGTNWARTAHYTDSRGTVAGYQTGRGRSGVVYSGDRGSGAVTRNRHGDVYAGKDGNVYRKNDNGSWQKYDDGNWNQTDWQKNKQQNQKTAEEMRREAQKRAEGAKNSDRYKSWQKSGKTRQGRARPAGGSRAPRGRRR